VIMTVIVIAGISASYCPAQTSALIEDSQPVWSPDGKKIAFISNRTNTPGEVSPTTNLWIVDADGSNLRQLTQRCDNQLPTWSPDGKKIAFQCDKQIWQVDVATGSFTQLTKADKPWLAPDWHPKDPSKILCSFQSFIPQDNDLAVINPQTFMTRESGKATLRVREGSDDKPRWSRDAKNIAFIGEVWNSDTRQSKWYLMTARNDGTGLKTFCELSKNASRPAWFLDGTKVLVDGGDVCDLTTGKTTSLFNEKISSPDISPDGNAVVYSGSVNSSGKFLFVRKLDGTGKKQITFPVVAKETEEADEAEE